MKAWFDRSVWRWRSSFSGSSGYLPLTAACLGVLLVSASAQQVSKAEYRLHGVLSRLTSNPESQGNASIHGHYAAWTQWASDGSLETDIFLYDLATGVERRVTGAGVQYQSALSNQKLAFTDGSKGDRDDDIMIYDISTGETSRLDQPGLQWAPEISGHWMVYNDWRHTNNEVYLCDLRTMTEMRLTDSPGIQGGPHVYGHHVVWTDFDAGNGDISLLDLRTGLVRNLTQHPAYDGQSGIDGDMVVFVSQRDGGIPNLFYHRLRSGETVQVTHASGQGVTDPHVSGDYVSYFEHDPASNRFNLYIYSISRDVSAPVPGLPTCTNCFRAWNAIYGHRVVFSDIVAGNQDVYLFNFQFDKSRTP